MRAMRPLLLVLPLALIVAGCGAAADERPTAAQVRDLAERAGAQLIEHPYQDGIGEHTDDPVRYATNPPTNGPHAFSWAADGNYAGVEPPPTEKIVHALEHGRVVIWYRRGLEAEQVARLERLFDESPHHVLLVENRTDMPCDVAATAWSQGILCRRLDDAGLDAIRAFRDRYVDQGPERVA